MGLIAVILDPSVLANPDLDLRYEVPDRIAEQSGGTIESAGYAYDSADRIHVYLETQDLAGSTKLVCDFLRTTVVLDNDLSGAQVAVRERTSGPLRLVYPEGSEGTIEDLE